MDSNIRGELLGQSEDEILQKAFGKNNLHISLFAIFRLKLVVFQLLNSLR